MPADLINLRRARKAKARDEKQRQSEANRLAFGRTKQEKTKTAAERDRAHRAIDAHRREKD